MKKMRNITIVGTNISGQTMTLDYDGTKYETTDKLLADLKKDIDSLTDTPLLKNEPTEEENEEA